MKIQIRTGLFETNSSSVHSLVMVSGNDYEKWKNGELVYDRMDDKLIPVEVHRFGELRYQNGSTILHSTSSLIMISWSMRHFQIVLLQKMVILLLLLVIMVMIINNE